jgi:CHAD domain-containing protein
VPSTPQLTTDLLAEPAQRAARLIARQRLASVVEVHERLGAGNPDTLHDLRVALRRLRSWVRAYRPVLSDTVRRRTRRALSKLARATNAARDAEVALAWVRSQRELQEESRAGHAYMIERLTMERDRSAVGAAAQLAKGLPSVARELEAQCSYYWLRVLVDDHSREPVMTEVTGRLARRHAALLGRALRRIESPADVDAAHRTRMAAKQLRYLLEPIDADRRAARVVERIRVLQDLLGDFHDAHLLARRMTAEIEEITPRWTLRPGLIELLERTQTHERASFVKFRRSWNVRGARTALDLVRALANDLRSGGLPRASG